MNLMPIQTSGPLQSNKCWNLKLVIKDIISHETVGNIRQTIRKGSCLFQAEDNREQEQEMRR